MNLISPCKLDSPAFSNSCFRAAADGGDGEGEEGEERRGKGKTNPCRGEQRERGRLQPLSHRQTAINKSIGNCGWLENGWSREDGGWKRERPESK